MKRNILRITVLCLFTLSAELALSQPPPPTNPQCWPPPCSIPLDGGVSFLIAAGVAYGGKKLYDANKKNP